MGLGLKTHVLEEDKEPLGRGTEVESGSRNTQSPNTQPLLLAQGHSGSVCSASSVRLHGACLCGRSLSLPCQPLKEMLNFGEETAEEGKEGKAGGTRRRGESTPRRKAEEYGFT